jgi:hypothetical protein
MINHGQIDVDESAMTGESLPVTLHEREMAKMGIENLLYFSLYSKKILLPLILI